MPTSPNDLGTAFGGTWLEASQSAYSRNVSMYGTPVLRLADKVEAQNIVDQRTKGEPASPRTLVAEELIAAGFGILRAEDGQELKVIAEASARLAMLAAAFDVADRAEPAPAPAPTRPTPMPAAAPLPPTPREFNRTVAGTPRELAVSAIAEVLKPEGANP